MMTKRLKRSQLKSFSVEVTSKHWQRAKLFCRHDLVTKTAGDQKVKSIGTGANCVIADALVEFLGEDVPLKNGNYWNTKLGRSVAGLIIDVEVGEHTAAVGASRYRHNGADLVEGFDSEKKLAEAKSEFGFELPMKVTFTRTK